jgi:hypothetical protein
MKDANFPLGKGTYKSVADEANREENDMPYYLSPPFY